MGKLKSSRLLEIILKSLTVCHSGRILENPEAGRILRK